MGEIFDRELGDCPPDVRRQIWKCRIEAVIFASARPVPRATLALVVGVECQLDDLVAELRDDLARRPYEIVEVAGGFQHRTRPEFAAAIQAAGLAKVREADLSQKELTVLVAVAYFQPITRGDLGSILGKPVSRDAIAALSRRKLIAAGPRSPSPGAPYTYVTTQRFLEEFDFKSLSELPDMDKLAEAGLLDRQRLWAEDDPIAIMSNPPEAED